MNGTEDLLGHREAARRYGISVPTIRRRVQEGQLQTFVRPIHPQKKLIRVADLEALMQPRPVDHVPPAEISAA